MLATLFFRAEHQSVYTLLLDDTINGNAVVPPVEYGQESYHIDSFVLTNLRVITNHSHKMATE